MVTNNVVDGLREDLSHGSSVTPFLVQPLRDSIVGADAVVHEGSADVERRLRLRMHPASGGLLVKVVEKTCDERFLRVIEGVRRGCYQPFCEERVSPHIL